jgi:RHS repeat-associated protein
MPSIPYLPTFYSARYTFSGKERDEETGFSYFGARYYNSSYSIWLSVDPMSDKYPSISPYAYCGNNPIKLVDPSGEEVGNYYDFNGNLIGNDGQNDDKVYVVTNKDGISVNDDKVNVNNSSSVTLLPSAENREIMINKMIEFDSNNPNSEWGGFVGNICTTEGISNKEVIRWGTPGKAGDPSKENSVVSYNPNTVDQSNLFVSIAFHSHPSGKGGLWKQEPSNEDFKSSGQIAAKKGSQIRSLVFGMKERNVYFYNSEGTSGKMSFDIFKSLK